MNRENKTKLIWAAVLTFVGILLPVIFYKNSQLLHSHLSESIVYALFDYPMYICVTLCGIICGYKLGAVSGVVVPLSVFNLYYSILYPQYTGHFTSHDIYLTVVIAAFGLASGLLIKKINLFFTVIFTIIAGTLIGSLVQDIFLINTEQTMIIRYTFIELKNTMTTYNFYILVIVETVIIQLIISIFKKLNLMPSQVKEKTVD